MHVRDQGLLRRPHGLIGECYADAGSRAAQPLTSWVTLGEALNLSEPHLAH